MRVLGDRMGEWRQCRKAKRTRKKTPGEGEEKELEGLETETKKG